MAGQIRYENKIYEFSWSGILIFVILAPLLAVGIYFSNDYVWLHGITSRITIWSLNLITGLNNYTVYDPNHYWGPAWYIYIENPTRTGYLSPIQFTTYCTGVQAIAIFTGVIMAVPHSKDPLTTKTIWPRKIVATVLCSALFYVVNIVRMWIQLYLYHSGYRLEDIHYSISSSSSLIAIPAVLVLHKYVPEFIMSIIWIMDQVRARIKGTTPPSQTELKSATPDSTPNSPQAPTPGPSSMAQDPSPPATQPSEATVSLTVSKSVK